MKAVFFALVKNPIAYVIGFSVLGASSVVAGVALLVGSGWAFVIGGAFLLAAAGFVTKGMTANG